MMYFRVGCVALILITTPALASEIMGVPEGSRIFWFGIFPAICLLFPVLLGSINTGKNFLCEYLVCALTVLTVQIPFLVKISSHSYFFLFIIAGVVQTIIPLVVHVGMLAVVSGDHSGLIKRNVCISGASLAMALCVWFGIMCLFK